MEGVGEGVAAGTGSRAESNSAIFCTRGCHDADGGFIGILRFHVCCT